MLAIFRDQGLLNPILVRRAEKGCEVISGHRRLAAYRRLQFAAKTKAEKQKYGASTEIRNGEQIVRRQPTSADIIHTALKVMGLGDPDIFIPGGSGEILGLRA